MYINVAELFLAAQVVKNLIDVNFGFFIDVEAGKQYLQALFVGTYRVDANLVSRRRAAAATTGNVNSIKAYLLNVHRIEVRDDIRVVIRRCFDFVE